MWPFSIIHDPTELGCKPKDVVRATAQLRHYFLHAWYDIILQVPCFILQDKTKRVDTSSITKQGPYIGAKPRGTLKTDTGKLPGNRIINYFPWCSQSLYNGVFSNTSITTNTTYLLSITDNSLFVLNAGGSTKCKH